MCLAFDVVKIEMPSNRSVYRSDIFGGGPDGPCICVDPCSFLVLVLGASTWCLTVADGVDGMVVIIAVADDV